MQIQISEYVELLNLLAEAEADAKQYHTMAKELLEENLELRRYEGHTKAEWDEMIDDMAESYHAAEDYLLGQADVELQQERLERGESLD